MHTILLENPSIFDRALHLLARIPAISNALPPIFVERAIQTYREVLLTLTQDQLNLHIIAKSQAVVEKRRYEKALSWLSPQEGTQAFKQPKSKELAEVVFAVVIKLRENIFLMNLIINDELEPADHLDDLLEDYYDGLLVQERRKNKDSTSWEQVKAELDAKHGLA